MVLILPESGSGAPAEGSIRDYVIVELKNEAALPAPTPPSTGAAEVSQRLSGVDELAPGFRIAAAAPLFSGLWKDSGFSDKLAKSAVSPATFDSDPLYRMARFVSIVPSDQTQCREIAEVLGSNPRISRAYVAPRPVPATFAAGPNFEPAQSFLCDPPFGLGVIACWNDWNATGRGITVCDIEYDWNLDHDDLPQNIQLVGGQRWALPGYSDHGTAVLGIMFANRGNFGCVGISHGATAKVQSAYYGGLTNPADAIFEAATALKAGDVILLELQARGGPDGHFLAMQHWDHIHVAIQGAVAKGVTVVEAAGNSGEDFDRDVYATSGLQKDAGAIVVGAGVPPKNYHGARPSNGHVSYSRIGTPRSRISFSNYGRIVNLQGWGCHVTSLGYGDAHGGSDLNKWFTLRFEGTSSAAPMVAAAAACVQEFAVRRIGQPLSPADLRDILITTGTPQEADDPRAPLTQKIGPQPNLAQALREVERRFAT